MAVEQVLSNLFPINIESDAVAYRYQVTIKVSTKKGKIILLTEGKEKTSEFEKWFKQYVCYEVLRETIKYHCKLEPSGVGLVYDKASCLYASKPLKNFEEKYEKTINRDKWSAILKNLNFEEFYVKVEKLQPLFLNDPTHFSGDNVLGRENRDLRNFIELLTSQPGVDSDDILDRPRAFYLKNDYHDMGHGIIMYQGARKGSRIVKNVDGQLQLKLSVEPVISAFYQEGYLSENIVHFFIKRNFKEACVMFLAVYKNCWLCYETNPSKKLHLREVTDEPLSELRFIDDNGKQVYVVDYYKERYGIQLKCLDLPAVVETKQGKKYYFPPELLYVIPKKVAQVKLDVILPVDTMLKANAIKPQERLKKTMEMLDLLICGARLFEKFGVSIDRENNVVPMKMAKFPVVKFARNRCEPDKKKTVFRPGNFVDPAVPPKCWVIVQGSGVSSADAQLLAQKFLYETESRGKKWPDVGDFVEFNTRTADLQQWKGLFEYLKKYQVEFACFLDLPTTKGDHNIIKLCERMSEILTQQLTTTTLHKLRNFYNPIAKTNCKLGGLNYLVIPESAEMDAYMKLDKILIIGMDVAHPSDLSTGYPSTVGFSSNTGKQVNGFVGNYVFQDALQEEVSAYILENIVAYMLTMRTDMRPNSPVPELILVLRDGLSEGQMSMALQDECVAIQKGFSRYYPDEKQPEVLFVVATKRHSRRFYRLDGKNLDPGSVMSEGVARNFANEFYMQSAYPLQGTGKTTDYEVLVNSKKFSHEEIVNFSFALCFSHQIVSSATSQPTPVMVAHESAKRGYNNAKTYAQCYGLPMENGEIDLNRLNRELSYVTSSLGYTRFNA